MSTTEAAIKRQLEGKDDLNEGICMKCGKIHQTKRNFYGKYKCQICPSCGYYSFVKLTEDTMKYKAKRKSDYSECLQSTDPSIIHHISNKAVCNMLRGGNSYCTTNSFFRV